MSLKLAARFVAVDPYKIADLQENDTVAHFLELSFAPKECMAILLKVERMAGAGSFQMYPRSHASLVINAEIAGSTLITIKEQKLKWKNTVANDDWDISLLGYFVQKRTR